ncbi:MAG: acetylglutamate kinase [Flexistipes sinusarabici]|uniref:Acetylglutamate kinase n=1 Tax=Flexistipes sinusarabici TaxID=2352 RepID=A0A5D0MKF9_FLESI|nr:acetylglutamate kinase [Flexistipes sinusarabici]TYB32395.1 MAG: acetylglutamate kinase [Flexistipes sinusarabici]
MQKLIEKASTLVESLPYIRRFYGKTIVVKYGGSAMVETELKNNFAKDIVLLKYVGINPIIVHGGGPQIAEMLEKMGIKTKFVSGMRVTDKETMSVVEMVLAGKVNKDIVNLINKNGGSAIGLSGKDGHLLTAEKLMVENDSTILQAPEIMDIGHVGRVKEVDADVIQAVSKDFIPIIAPVGIDDDYEAYNINADLVAGSVAAAVKAEKLIILTDVRGVLDNDGSLISSIKTDDVPRLKHEKIIKGGMIPKTDAAVTALQAGINKAHIVDGRILHSVLLEIFTDSGIGTQITL